MEDKLNISKKSFFYIGYFTIIAITIVTYFLIEKKFGEKGELAIILNFVFLFTYAHALYKGQFKE